MARHALTGAAGSWGARPGHATRAHQTTQGDQGACLHTIPAAGSPNIKGPARPPAQEVKKDYNAVRKAIADVLDADNYDDGSYGPVLVRLAWHASGTYDVKTATGGSDGATMRFAPEAEWGANAGLAVARQLLEPIKAKFPWISYADLWTLAGAVAIEEMGGGWRRHCRCAAAAALPETLEAPGPPAAAVLVVDPQPCCWKARHRTAPGALQRDPSQPPALPPPLPSPPLRPAHPLARWPQRQARRHALPA
jgi:hypothetical protein